MTAPVSLGQPSEVEYPDSDGQPMSDNTLQFQWIVTLQGNLDALFENDRNVFVAGDLLWYPVQGRNDVCAAPDALVVFGRPKGYRGSYKQWEEGGIAPQVVFEVLSPNNRPEEMEHKFQFYDSYGVEEYYLYDPFKGVLSGWRRSGERLQSIAALHNWVSPRLRVRFDLSEAELVIYDATGQRFLTFLQVYAQWQAGQKRIEQERLRAEQAEQRAVKAEQRAVKAEQQARDERLQREKAEQRATEAARETDQRAQRLADKLRELGIDPETLSD